jgi:outer membrane protein TolC
MNRALATTLCCLCSISLIRAQQSAIEPVKPAVPAIVRPYMAPEIPPVRVANSGRLRDLVRAATLYLTAQDAIALALENNIDIEVARYNPLVSAWQLERAQAGGALPGVPSNASQAGSVASGQGILGSRAAAGVSTNAANNNGNGAGNATISQIGPITQTLDPSIQGSSTFSHTTTPQADVVQSLLPILISNTRVYTGSYQQGFLTGGAINVSYSDHYLNENAPTDVLNPSVAPNVSFAFQHNLLQGFGVAVNARNITVAKMNLKISDLNFKTQVIGTVTSVLNLYYALVVDYEDVRAKKSAVEAAERFYEESQQRLQLGSLSPLDLTTAESQAASSQNDLVVSQTNLEQQELQLKNALSRTGVMDPVLASVEIMPLDQIVIPEKDDLPPIKELVARALANRSDLAAERASIKTAEVSALGTKNGVLPSLQVFGAESQAGLAGTPKTVTAAGVSETANPYFTGGIGTALSQVFKRDFPTERIGAFVQAPVFNRQAQADSGIDQLQLRQTQLTTQRDLNQVAVDVSNYVVALRQARARYAAAAQNRILQQQLLDAEQEKFGLGASTPYNVIQQQRDLAAAQSTEIAALAAYGNARVALDQTLGTTLETNHVSIEDARAGKTARVSTPPAEK